MTQDRVARFDLGPSTYPANPEIVAEDELFQHAVRFLVNHPDEDVRDAGRRVYRRLYLAAMVLETPYPKLEALLDPLA
jgi:hypothetical protein